MSKVRIGIVFSFGVVGNALGFAGLEKSSLVGMNFVNSSSLGGGLASGLNSINMGTVAGASAQSAGAFDFVIMYAALMVFLLGSLYLLHEKRLS